jgi:hypothetical protein
MVGVAAMATLGVVSGVSAKAALDKSSKPKIQKVSLSPTSVSGNGGQVKVKVKVTGVTNPVVLAPVQLAGHQGAGGSTRLTRSGRNAYVGMVEVVGNPQASTNKASVVVSATKGTKSTVKIIGYVKVGPGSASPPPPPPHKFR